MALLCGCQEESPYKTTICYCLPKTLLTIFIDSRCAVSKHGGLKLGSKSLSRRVGPHTDLTSLLYASLRQSVRQRFSFNLRSFWWCRGVCSTTNSLSDFGDYIPACSSQSSRVSCILMDSLKATSICILAEIFLTKLWHLWILSTVMAAAILVSEHVSSVTPQPKLLSHTRCV